MIFKDRAAAAEELAAHLKNEKDTCVVSLLRGGIVVGDIISKKLRATHLPMPVTKIPAPHNEELAIGALCFDVVYLEGSVIKRLGYTKSQTSQQIKIAREKFSSYCQRFTIVEDHFEKVKGKTVILTDDGIATGSTARAATLFLKSYHPKKIILAVPVAPTDFDTRGFDKFIVLHQDANFSSVSQFYQNFPQVEDEDVKKLING